MEKELICILPLLRGVFLAQGAGAVMVRPQSREVFGEATEGEAAEKTPQNQPRTLHLSIRKDNFGASVPHKDEREIAKRIGQNFEEFRQSQGSLPSTVHVEDIGTFECSSWESGRGRLNGKIALVTGAAQGFGAELAGMMMREGAFVFIADINWEGTQKMAERLKEETGSPAVLPVEVDVVDEVSVRKMMFQVAQISGGLDIIVSNAGVLRAGSVMEMSREDFDFVTDVNYRGFFLMTKHFSPLMIRQGFAASDWGMDIVQINSKSGLSGSNKNGAYAGSKFGGLGLVQSFAMELIEYGIKVNAICPGNFFDGPLWSDPKKGLFVQYLKANKVPHAKNTADVKAFYEAKVPMKRGCRAEDVFRALLYSVEQCYETGQAIPVSGGQIMLK